MKKIKYLSVVILTLLLSISLYGCGSEASGEQEIFANDTANSIYSVALESYKNLDSIYADITTETTSLKDDISLEGSGDVKMINLRSDDFQMEKSFSSSHEGQPVTTDYYYSEGMMYLSSQDYKYKFAYTTDQAFRIGYFNPVSLDEEDIESSDAIAEGESTKLEFNLAGNEEFTEQLGYVLGSDYKNASIKYTEIKYTVVVTNNIIEKILLEADYSIGLDEEKTDCKAVVNLTFNNDSNEIPEPPKDIDLYEDDTNLDIM